MKHYNDTQPKLINNSLHISLYPSFSPASTHARTRTTIDTHRHTILQPLGPPPPPPHHLSPSLSPTPSTPRIMHQPAIRKFLLFCLELYMKGLRPCVFCLLTTSPSVRHNYFPTAVHSAKFIHSSNAFQEKKKEKKKKRRMPSKHTTTLGTNAGVKNKQWHF